MTYLSRGRDSGEGCITYCHGKYTLNCYDKNYRR